MKNNNDIIGNRTRDLQAYNAVPQPTALCEVRRVLTCLPRFNRQHKRKQLRQ
jgi:hypothetical protein